MELGGAIYLTKDGRELEVCEVMEVSDDFVWPLKRREIEAFHADDAFGGADGPLGLWGDLVFEGEVIKFLRLSPKAAERAALELEAMDYADDFGFLEEA